MPTRPVVHIIDDDAAVRDALETLLRVRGLSVQAYPSAHAFLDAPTPDSCGCVLTDVQMPQMTGLELLRRIEDRRLGLPVIVMTGRAERGMALQAMAAGAAAFVDKPFGPDEIVSAVRQAIAACAGCA